MLPQQRVDPAKFYSLSFCPVKAAKIHDTDTQSYIYSGLLDFGPFVPLSFLDFGQCFQTWLGEQAHCIPD